MTASSSRRVAPRITILLLVALVASAVSVWWLVGDLSEVDDPTADFMIRPPDLSSAEEGWIGGCALVLLAATLVALYSVHRTSGLSRSQRWALLFVVLAGGIIGVGYRVMTAATIGANIGGGLLLTVGVPVVAFLLVRAGQLVRRRDP